MTDLTEAEKEFLAFDWAASDKWQKYFSDLYPTPKAVQVVKFKRKWFRTNVNKNLDVNSTVGDPKPASETPQSTDARETTSRSTGPTYNYDFGPARQIALMNLTGAMSMTILMVFMSPGRLYMTTYWFYMVGFIAELYATFGAPGWTNNEYWTSIIMHDVGQSLPLLMVGLLSRSITYMIPPFLTAAIVVANTVKRHQQPAIIANISYVKQAVDYVDKNTMFIMTNRAHFEVIIGIFNLITLFLGRNTLIVVFLYWSILRYKYSANAFTQGAFREINQSILTVIRHPMCPSLVGFVYEKISNFLHSYASLNQRTPPRTGCTIM